MQVLIVGGLGGQIGAASKIAMARGATVQLAESVTTSLNILRAGNRIDLVMADITLDVDVAEHLGSTSYVYANAGGEALVIEREESRHEASNETITVSVSADKAYLFDSKGARLR